MSGYVEPGETPTEACAREVKEELGLDREVGRLLVADWAPSEREGDKILFVFDGGLIDEDQLHTVKLPPEELDTAKFHSRAELDHLLIPRLARRVKAAFNARDERRTDYLEHGAPLRSSFLNQRPVTVASLVSGPAQRVDNDSA